MVCLSSLFCIAPFTLFYSCTPTCGPDGTTKASTSSTGAYYGYPPPNPGTSYEAKRQTNPVAWCLTMSRDILDEGLPTPTAKPVQSWIVTHAATATTHTVAEKEVPVSLRGDWCAYDASRAHWYTAHVVPLVVQCAGRPGFISSSIKELKLSPHTTTSAWCGACTTCTVNTPLPTNAVPRQTGDAMMAGAVAIGGAVLALV
ncbi:hypothetical protein PG993_000315 [Apiospora rasikravindrae]|uniref:Uncharacterized protein n=1 Tax=Apiospora rasikravindrae TaxID=990691 RepID=A0ABR1U8A4_9PEZI